MLEVTYGSAQMERVCSDERFMRKEVGADAAKALKRRLAELRSAETIKDVLDGPGRWETLRADPGRQWSARLTPNWRLIVETEGPDATTAVVVRLQDYH
jgi:proteic killer suppression protein